MSFFGQTDNVSLDRRQKKTKFLHVVHIQALRKKVESAKPPKNQKGLDNRSERVYAKQAVSGEWRRIERKD